MSAKAKVDFSAAVKLVGAHWLAEVFTINDDGSSDVFARTIFENLESAQRWARETAEALEEAGELSVLAEIDGAVTDAVVRGEEQKQAKHKLKLSASVRHAGNRWLAEVFSLGDDGSSKVLARNTFPDAESAQHWGHETVEALEEAGDLAVLAALGDKVVE
jgi:hypothetical protein